MVIKRDGRKVSFNKDKIIYAIESAFIEIDGLLNQESIQISNSIASQIETLYKINEKFDVERIQDLVEELLMSSERKDVAKSYVLYREKRRIAREKKSSLVKNVAKAINASDIQNQNANVDEKSFGGRVGAASDATLKQYALDYLMSETAVNNHLNNMIYTHDLSSYAAGNHNCLSIPFDDLLANGFKTRQVDIRPANSVNTALQLVAVIFQLQSLQQFGGCSATHLDWTLVPYIRKSFAKHFKDGIKYLQPGDAYDWIPSELSFTDYIAKSVNNHKAYKYAIDMTERELNQAVEAMYHNLNSLQSRSGNQLPFTSINFGTCILPEGQMIIRAILNGCIKGVGKFHRTSIFPCLIFQLKKGINRLPGEPNYYLYQLAMKSTALRLYPNYANCDWSINAGYDEKDPRQYVSTMGCRTYNGFDINGLGFQKDGRGNIAPVTIIMPTLAMEAGQDIDKFMLILDLKIHEAKDQLIERYEYICSQTADSASFMYENNVIAGYISEEGIRSALRHGTLAIGNIGLAETLQLLLGYDHTTPKGMNLAKRIYQLMNNRCNEFKHKYHLNFGLYNTPAENLCYTSMIKFKEKYGVIPNVSDHDYFTNSMHVPVWHKMTPFEKIDIESQLTGYSNAGCITYVELESTVKNNLSVLEKIINYAMDKDIPYFAINVPNDTCLECGFTDELPLSCPQCGSTQIERLRRVTGYLSTDYHHFNKGKIQEVEMRVKHSTDF